MTFQFNATHARFEFDSYALAGRAWKIAQRATIATLRAFHPEIERWPVNAVGVAWEAYSSDIHACSWADVARAQDGWFLTYLYIRQLCPEIDFWALSFDRKQFTAFAASKPWSVSASLPDWVSPDPPNTA